jgi:hypothetical protein
MGRQQEGIRTLTRGWVGAYTEFFSPLAYAEAGHEGLPGRHPAGLEATEQVARQGLRVAEEATEQGLRVVEEATERTEDVLRQTEKATREAEVRAAVYSALGTTDYDALTVDEVCQEDRRPSRRAARESARVREEQQGPRDPRRSDRPQDKGRLLRR